MPREFKLWHVVFLIVVILTIWQGSSRSGKTPQPVDPPKSIGTVPVSSSTPSASSTSTSDPTSTTTAQARATASLPVGIPFYDVVPAGCTIRGASPAVLPDPSCTPGATNPAVTRATLGSTICLSGWTDTVRPSSSFTTSLKKRQMAAWGISGTTRTTEEDHLIPLALGGAPSDSRNLWPQSGGIPNPKDRLEVKLKAMVCAGQLRLKRAQIMVATDWVAAYRQVYGLNP